MFKIITPVGWDGIKFTHPIKDKHLHHIETWDSTDQDWISIAIYWNKLYSDIPIDEKHPYRSKHYHLKLSIDEAKQLRDSLNHHLKGK